MIYTTDMEESRELTRNSPLYSQFISRLSSLRVSEATWDRFLASEHRCALLCRTCSQALSCLGLNSITLYRSALQSFMELAGTSCVLFYTDGKDLAAVSWTPRVCRLVASKSP